MKPEIQLQIKTTVLYGLTIFIINLLIISCATTIKYAAGTQEQKKGITVLENIKLNGLKHAVLIRSRDLDNPILLHLHGNGIPAMCFYHDEYISDSLKEGKFIMVHYDQRGFGKTYRHGKHGKKKIHVDQYVEDSEELITYLMKRFNKQKIYLIGESWGTVIGAKLVAKHPEWLYAYIAVPQVADVKEFLNEAYNFSLNEAESDSNSIAIEELKKYGKPEINLSKKQLNKSISITGKWMDYYNLKRYNGQDMSGYFFKSLWNAPEYSMFDFVSTLKGYMYTAPKLNQELIRINLLEDVPEINVPAYFIIGEYDLMMNTSKKYFDQLKSDKKYWIPVKNAGHMVRGEQYEVFDSIIYNTVLPETFH
jgi:pimeloyl-ACP methyl ester carboxylesterase